MKKITAPVIIFIITIVPAVIFSLFIATEALTMLTVILFILPVVIFVILFSLVLKERIKEIKQGENDDLGKY